MADSGTGYQSHLAEDRQRLVDLQIVLVLWTDSKDRRPLLVDLAFKRAIFWFVSKTWITVLIGWLSCGWCVIQYLGLVLPYFLFGDVTDYEESPIKHLLMKWLRSISLYHFGEYKTWLLRVNLDYPVWNRSRRKYSTNCKKVNWRTFLSRTFPVHMNFK